MKPSQQTTEAATRLIAAGFRFEPTGDRSACYPTKHGSWDRPKLPLVLDWESYMKPSKQAIKAAEKYYRLEAEHDCFLGRRDQLATIIQAAIDEATAPLIQQLGDQERLANDMMLERDSLARQLAESRPAQDWRAVAQKQIADHKIKAEDTPA